MLWVAWSQLGVSLFRSFMRLWADDVGTGVMQRLDWAGCPRWLPHVIGSWCWTSAVNSVWDYQWPASSFSVWFQYGDWETNVPIGRKHKMLGKWRAMPGASTTWFLPYFIGQSPLPCQDSRGGHRDARSWWGSVKTTLQKNTRHGRYCCSSHLWRNSLPCFLSHFFSVPCL